MKPWTAVKGLASLGAAVALAACAAYPANGYSYNGYSYNGAYYPYGGAPYYAPYATLFAPTIGFGWGGWGDGGNDHWQDHHDWAGHDGQHGHGWEPGHAPIAQQHAGFSHPVAPAGHAPPAGGFNGSVHAPAPAHAHSDWEAEHSR